MRRRTAAFALVASLWATPVLAGAGATPVVDELERGVALFERGDFAAAARHLERARAAAPHDLDGAVLLGIAYYRLGRPAEALPLLREAARSAVPETASSARIFLALLARARGDERTARAELGALPSSSPPELARSARTLLEAGRPHRLSALLVVRSEVDSNVPLLSTSALGDAGRERAADGDLLSVAALTLRPLPALGLTLSDSALYRKQLRLEEFDLFTNSAAARYAATGGPVTAEVGYAFEAATLDGAAYTRAHLADAAVGARLAGALRVAAHGALTQRDYFPGEYAPYSGWIGAGALEASWAHPTGAVDVGVAYVVVREAARADALAATAQGARLRAGVALGARGDLTLGASALHRSFDAASGGRRDDQLWADLTIAVGLGARLSLIVAGALLRNVSTEADFDHLKATASLGLAYGYDGP